MAQRRVEESSLTSIADAIRNKSGTTGELKFPGGFKAAIDAIETDNGVVPTGTIEITTNGTHDVTAYASANVNVPTQSEEGGIVPSGTIAIKENGDYNVTNYANASVAVEPKLQSKTVTPTTNQQIVRPDTNYDGLSQVTVEGVSASDSELVLQSKSVTPSASQKIITPDSGYDGMSEVIVAGDSDLVAGNIKKNVNIFGVTGTYEGSSVDAEIEVDDLSELHAWSKYTIGGTVIKTYVTDVLLGTVLHSNGGITVEYANKEDTSSGSLALSTEGYGTVKVTSDSSGAVLKGKVVRVPANQAYLYYEIPTTATVDFQSGTLYDNLKVSEAKQITYTPSDGVIEGVVVSENRNAYPDNGEQDGYKYVYNGTLDSGGVTLPTLTNPGAAEDLAKGKQLIGADGNVVIGTVNAYDKNVGYGDISPQLSNNAVLLRYETSNPILFRNGFCLSSPLSSFGNAQKRQVLKGATFTSEDGLCVEGELEVSSGVELPSLDNPATAADLAKDKQLIDANGNVVTGTVSTFDSYIVLGNRVPTLYYTNDKIMLAHEVSNPLLFRNGFALTASLSDFGNATEADVRAGKTFTSIDGLVKQGKNNFRDIKTITIEEV